jgi:uncharacterized repeat protein (TIGR02543 family)
VAGSLAAAATYSSVYFLSAAGVPPATGAGGTGAGHTASALSSSALMAAWGPGGLGDAFRRSRGGANGGYPVLAWELADASALDASIAAAVLARGPVRTSADGRDVPDGLRWAPVAACTALDAAVASAVAASEDLALSADALAARASTLDAALSAFQTQVKTAAVSRTALSAKASSLRSLLASTAASANGRDVAQGKAWATPAVRTALAAALAKAQAALSDVAATQAGTDAALSALSTAERAFKAKVGKGTKAASHTVRLDANGGKLAAKAASLKKAHGAAVGNITAKPTRTGYTFQGWFTAKSSSGKKVSAKAKVTKDVTYWAHWKANGPVVTLNANGGKVGKAASASVVRTKGKALGKLAAPTRAGYTFLGWYTGKVKGTKVTTRTKVTRSVTLYAHWKAKTYTVKLNANGGKLGKASTTSLKKTHNAKFGKLATPKRTGYTFQGWYTGKVKGTKVTASTKVTRAVTLYAHWKRTAG